MLKTDQVRADTTVIEANVAYPSDSSLLAKYVAKIVRVARKVQGQGLATRTTVTDRTRSVRSRARSVGANLRRRTDEKLAEAHRMNRELVRIARRSVREAETVVRNARRGITQLGDHATGRQRADVASPGLPSEWNASRLRPSNASMGPHRRARHGSCHCTIRREADRQRPARQASRVRRQGPTRRQRRWRDHRPQHREWQPARCTTWRTGCEGRISCAHLLAVARRDRPSRKSGQMVLSNSRGPPIEELVRIAAASHQSAPVAPIPSQPAPRAEKN